MKHLLILLVLLTPTLGISKSDITIDAAIKTLSELGNLIEYESYRVSGTYGLSPSWALLAEAEKEELESTLMLGVAKRWGEHSIELLVNDDNYEVSGVFTSQLTTNYSAVGTLYHGNAWSSKESLTGVGLALSRKLSNEVSVALNYEVENFGWNGLFIKDRASISITKEF